MSDLSVLIVVVMVLALIIIPMFLFMVEKNIVLMDMEVLKDYIDLGLNNIILELNVSKLSHGNLSAREYEVKNAMKSYFDANKISYEDIEIDLKEIDKDLKGEITLKVIFKRHIYKSLLSNEGAYEITRKFTLPVDR
ncbi:MAG: hypothetical protein KAH05_05190 [Clostridiales bacterium]|nr:hypothetical protein [Clostridiales bacterium]